jgi:hypothetical protein
MHCGAVWQLVTIFVERWGGQLVGIFIQSFLFSLMNAICSFIGIYFNAKNRPHITLSREEAKVNKS